MPQQPLPLEQLIGGPLRALVLAQGIAAQATVQFVSEAGFDRPPGGGAEARARTVDFTYIHPVPDPRNPGAVIHTPVRVSVPLLALVSVPNFRISEATVNVRASIVDVKQRAAADGEASIERKPGALLGNPMQIQAIYAPLNPGLRAVAAPGLSFSIKVVSEPVPEGLSKIITLLQDAMTSEATPEKPKEPPKEPPKEKQTGA